MAFSHMYMVYVGRMYSPLPSPTALQLEEGTQLLYYCCCCLCMCVCAQVHTCYSVHVEDKGQLLRTESHLRPCGHKVPLVPAVI